MPNNLPVPSRPRDGAMLGGVCAGLARRWQVDANLLRIAVVVLALFGGLGLACYAAGLALMPRDGSTVLPIRRFLPFTRTWPDVGVVVATIGALALLSGLGSNGIGLGPLAVIGAMWFFGFRNQGRPAAPPAEPTPFERQAEAWRVRLAEQQTPGYTATPLAGPAASGVLPSVGYATPPVAPVPAAAPQWTQPYTDPADLAVRDNLPPAVVADRARRRRHWLMAGLLSGIGVAIVTVLGVVFGLSLDALPYAAAILAALGLTLLASSRGGRPRLLLPLTVVVAAVTAVLMLPAPASVGDRGLVYSGSDLPPDRLDLGAGDLKIDLSGLELAADRTLDLELGAGELTIDVPVRGTTIVNYHVGAGEITTRQHLEGIDLRGSETYSYGDAAGPVLKINVDVKLGDVRVRT